MTRLHLRKKVNNMTDFQPLKKLVRQYHKDFDESLYSQQSTAKDIIHIAEQFTTPDWHWRGMHPFYEQIGAENIVSNFWYPLKQAFTALHRREDIFFAGAYDVDKGASHWVCSMGHFAGLFDKAWLGIAPTGKLTYLRYAEFYRIESDKIVETALFCDILSVMHQAGQYPLAPMTGVAIIQPGPRTHDGLLYASQPQQETQITLDLVNLLIADLDSLTKSGNDSPPPEFLQRVWHDNITWYGPIGIGASATIPRYQQQHQYPFRNNLTDKTYHGHIARFAEGHYCGFFGWPNLYNRNKGGFLGLPANNRRAEMRVVDIYRREGDKIAENWVFIDILHYLAIQGLDVLRRQKDLQIV